MPLSDRIFSLDLMYDEMPMPFVIKKVERLNSASIGTEALPHRHNYYSIIWPRTGDGQHIIDFKNYRILPDHIFFVSPKQVHQVLISKPLTAYIIMFTSEFLERNSIRNDFISNLKLFRNSDETPPLPPEEKMISTLETFADRMLSEFTGRSEMYMETIGAYLKLFLIECNGHCSLSPGSNPQAVEVSKTIIKNFRDLVDEQYTKIHQVKDYAANLAISPNYLNEVIKSAMNISAKEFIQSRIILEAKRLALFTGKSAKEIGFELGFDDPSHFSKFFKTNTGKSIQDFRVSLSI